MKSDPESSPADWPDDAAAARAAQQGEAGAFAVLVQRHLRVMYAVALGVLGRPQDAEDAVQDACLIAFRRIGECRDSTRVRAWLLRIARNRAHNLAEYHRVRRHEELHDTVRDASPARDPQRTLETGELRGRLVAALQGLTPLRRSVVLLHDLEDLTHAEIAESLGISVGMSRKHLMQARRQLRSALRATDGAQ